MHFTLEPNCDPGNNGMRRDLKLMKLEHDYILAKIGHAKLKDKAFTHSVLLVILLGLNVLLVGI
ncbi:unnamed protein product [Coffea canephora]|uniref:Uncharacterized protein n=1 Tax=Coffea canephora TaxID=49390 RepID=A0A068VAC6_COFCA|nr:unnamed protein product [Coffea canephora]